MTTAYVNKELFIMARPRTHDHSLIRGLFYAGLSTRRIARLIGASQSTVARAVAGMTVTTRTLPPSSSR